MNKIKVAIVDTGIDLKHDFLKNSISSGYGFVWESHKALRVEDFSDINGHGTACASIILNECSNVEFIVVKAMNDKGRTNLCVIEEALQSLIETDASIINMSFAINKNIDSDLYDICNELVNRNKILVSSLANDFDDSYPACFNNVIGVRGFILESKDTIWFDRNNKIQCIADNNPLMCCSINNTYQIRTRCNSLATAKLTGIICRLIDNDENISINNINYSSTCTMLEKYAFRNTWSKKDFETSKRYPNEKDWYFDNNHLLLRKIYDIVKDNMKIMSEEKDICNCYLLNKIGGLTCESTYEFIKYIAARLNVNINFMDISRDDILTIGSITKFFQKYI